MSIKGKISLYLSCLKRVHADIKQLSKGQKANYDLLQLAHRLEKGLLIETPKLMWGWEKANRIVELLDVNDDPFSTQTAKAVLSAFLSAKSKSQYEEDRQKYQEFIDKTHFVPEDEDGTKKMGGTIKVEKPVFTSEEFSSIEKMFNTRHSCREFATDPVPDEIISRAVELALRCPSACNRQPFKVYVITPNKLESKLGHKLQYKAGKTLIITGDVRAFTSGELLDWIVSPSIFVGYLTLALHSLGIGSCVIRKDLVKHSRYNEALKEVAGIGESERIILEMFVGYYKNQYMVPMSNRTAAKSIMKFL